MSKLIARLISFLASPLILLLPSPYILVDKVSKNPLYALKWTVFSYVFLFSLVVYVVLGIFLGFFSDFDVSKKEERPRFFAFGAILTFLYLVSLFILAGPRILFVGTIGIILGVLVISIVNKWIKASVHTATVSAFSLSLVIIYGKELLPVLLLIPVVAWARVKIKKHTLLEVIVGGFLGLFLTIIVYISAKKFLP
ncbi:hypothetical protein M1146_01440 [Patescibacteria group bacterium]|nr:hypothetical protein [Patescibacteria group bacterium]